MKEDNAILSHDNIEIVSIKQNFDRKDALAATESRAGGYRPQVQRLVYYPYYHFLFQYSVKTLLGRRKGIKASCFVDLINNRAATTDSFTTETVRTSASSVLDSDFTESEAFETARKYLTHAAIHQMKALLIPEYEVLDRKIIYRPFWIIKCSGRNDYVFRLIVDSVTGKYQIL